MAAARRAALVLAGLVALGYAAVWAIPPLHLLVAESILTSRHHSLAWLVATPAQQAAWSQQWAKTPDVKVVTPVNPTALRRDAALGISLRAVAGLHYRGWVLLVHNPAMLHVGLTDQLGKVGEQPSTFGKRAGAIAAINGGGFLDPQGQGTGGLPTGLTVVNGRVMAFPDDGSDYAIGFDASGRLLAGKWTLAQARALGLRQAVSFKPLLVVGGRGQITQGDGGWGIAPRTAIGQRADGTVIFAVIDGRQPASLGATLRQVQDLMLAQGAVTAVNLDGGSSTALWYRGQVVNHPCCSPNGQRYIPTVWLVESGG
jgi:exopolysaccharide biosynthesis protein